MDEDLYDEFGNYIGPDISLEDSDDELPDILPEQDAPRAMVSACGLWAASRRVLFFCVMKCRWCWCWCVCDMPANSCTDHISHTLMSLRVPSPSVRTMTMRKINLLMK